ncbi:MAG TPA: GNAT family N-acetyltransferase [Pyrinomonadaceae bacterium]|nr:GNAT family N-acetyltransferase [Pyrinomonadaceae bacterium]
MKIDLRFLRNEDFSDIHKTFLEAYSDYVIKFQLTEAQLENHIAQNGVKLEKSVGAFADNKMIGVTLNGIGDWLGKETVYDAGTGVIPEFRKKGAGKAMFDFMTPNFKKNGFKQILLEVISHNENAFRLYKKIGFEEKRRLIFFEQKQDLKQKKIENLEIRELENPDWHLFEKFCDGKPSWQNSKESITRMLSTKCVLGAFSTEKLVGYGAVFSRSGTIAQLAVDRKHRGKGIALNILGEIRKRIEPKTKLRISNVDENIEGFGKFMKKCGFEEFLSQIEMVKDL